MADTETPVSDLAHREPVSVVLCGDLDGLLTAQIAVAWAGEKGEDRRLGWWDSDLTGELGGEDLFRALLPATWAWATLQAARAAATRCDAAMRARGSDPDAVLTLFFQGFVIDELAEERLRDLKGSGQSPLEALPGLSEVIGELRDRQPWDQGRFTGWLAAGDAPETEPTPLGRRIKGPVPEGLDRRVRQLLGALTPLADHYPLPHYRRPA
jgi:hypothetical protein